MTQVHRICLEERTQINTDLSPKQINWKTDASSRFSCSSWFAGQILHSMVECCSCTSDICWTQLVTLCSELMVEIQTVSKNTTNVLFLLKRWTCFCELTCQGFFKSSKPFAFQPFRSNGWCETTLLLSSMIYVSMYTECAGLLAKTLMDIVVSQYSLQEITIIFILELSANLLFYGLSNIRKDSKVSSLYALFPPTNSLKPKDKIFRINAKLNKPQILETQI